MVKVGLTVLVLCSFVLTKYAGSIPVAEILFNTLSDRLSRALDAIHDRFNIIEHSITSNGNGHHIGVNKNTKRMRKGKSDCAADIRDARNTVLKSVESEKELLRRFVKEQEQHLHDLNQNVLDMLSEVNKATRQIFKNENLDSKKMMDDKCTTSCGKCYDRWRLAATINSTGTVTQGSKLDLIRTVMSGADVRIHLTSDDPRDVVVASVQNAQQIGDNLCVQSLLLYEPSFRICFIVCTTGHVHRIKYPVGSGTLASNETDPMDVKWFIRAMNNTPLKHSRVIGDIDNLVSDVKAASDVRIVNEKSGYTTTIDNIQVSTDNTIVVGQSLYSMSQHQVGDNYQFQGNEWLFTNWVSDSRYHTTRWTVGEQIYRGDTSGSTPITWYTDSCWQLAYKHDAAGNELEGSLNFLRMAVLRGHRVKLLYGDKVNVEPDEIKVQGDHVIAVILRMVRKLRGDITMFDDNAEWDWRILTTTGRENGLIINIGEKYKWWSTNTRSVAWYIDTRPWTKVLGNSRTGSVMSGSTAELVNAISKGARVRYILRFNKHASVHEPDALAILDNFNGVFALTRSVSTVGNGDELKFPRDPYWLFTMAGTDGIVRMSRWTVGENTPRGDNSSTANIEWFVNY